MRTVHPACSPALGSHEFVSDPAVAWWFPLPLGPRQDLSEHQKNSQKRSGVLCVYGYLLAVERAKAKLANP